MQTIDTPRPTAKKPARRVGYSVGAAGNPILIVVVNSPDELGLAALFPFDFSTSFDWAMVVRVILILAMVGTGIAILTDFFKWLTGGSTGGV